MDVVISVFHWQGQCEQKSRICTLLNFMLHCWLDIERVALNELTAGSKFGRSEETLVPAALDYCNHLQLMFILYVITGQVVETTSKIPKSPDLQGIRWNRGELRTAHETQRGSMGCWDQPGTVTRLV
jgi:hypothetical protein